MDFPDVENPPLDVGNDGRIWVDDWTREACAKTHPYFGTQLNNARTLNEDSMYSRRRRIDWRFGDW